MDMGANLERIEVINQCHHVVVPLDHLSVVRPRDQDYLYKAVHARIEKDRDDYLAFLDTLLPYLDSVGLQEVPSQRISDHEPYWQNGYFSGGDARALYSVIASRRPSIYLEIGSGNSTKFVRKAVRDHGLETRVVSVDPEPRAEIDSLCDQVVRQSLLDLDPSILSQLKAGDVLFLDGSHLVFNGTDTVAFFLEVLPTIATGVLIHVHDINLPNEYVSDFDNRGYAEQYLLASTLLYSQQFTVLLPVAYLSRTGVIPWGGVSFWFEKK